MLIEGAATDPLGSLPAFVLNEVFRCGPSAWLRLATLILTLSASAAEILPPDRPISEAIDHYVDARLSKAGVTPAGQIDDYNLIRRLTLDLVGRIPTSRESREFVESSDPKKREQLVDRLMASPEFIRFQAMQFESMLAGPRSRRGGGLHEYLVRAIGENRPWDQIFRELLLPNDNDPKTKGASDYLKSRLKDIDRMTIDVSVAFFGVNVSCAQCHDHPLVSDWKQAHFYGMKSFFARTFDNGGFLAERGFGNLKYKPTKRRRDHSQDDVPHGDQDRDEPDGADQGGTEEGARAAREVQEGKEVPAAAAVQRAGETCRSGFAAEGIRVFLAIDRQSPLAPLPRLRTGHAARPDAQRKQAEPSGVACLAGPRHQESQIRHAADDSRHRLEQDLFAIEQSTTSGRRYAASGALCGRPIEAADADADGDIAQARNDRSGEFRKDQAGRIGETHSKQSKTPPADWRETSRNRRTICKSASARHCLFSNGDKLSRELLGEGNDRLLTKAKSMNDPAKAVDLIVHSVHCAGPRRPTSRRR